MIAYIYIKPTFPMPPNRKEQFKSFSDTRLIEVVKNARQFGYDNETKTAALEVLKERGISEQDLYLTGNLTNDKFDSTESIYNSYTSNSRIAFYSYIVFILLKSLSTFHLIYTSNFAMTFSIIILVLLLAYFFFLVRSFIDHLNFYKSIGKEPGLGDQLIYFLVGMPFYIFMYFFYKSQMREEMKMIN